MTWFCEIVDITDSWGPEFMIIIETWQSIVTLDTIHNSWIASSCVKEAPWSSHVPPMVLWWSSRPLMVSPNMSKTRSRHNPWWGLLHSDWRKRPSKHEPHKLYYLRVSDGLVRFGTAITAFRFDYFLGRNIKDAYIQTDIQSSNKEGKYIWMNSAQHETLLSEFNFTFQFCFWDGKICHHLAGKQSTGGHLAKCLISKMIRKQKCTVASIAFKIH